MVAPPPHHVEILLYIKEWIITKPPHQGSSNWLSGRFYAILKRQCCVLSLIKAHSVTGTYHMLLYSFFIKYFKTGVIINHYFT